MKITNEINGGRGVMISENPCFYLEGRCSIQLSYGRNRHDISRCQLARQSQIVQAARTAGEQAWLRPGRV